MHRRGHFDQTIVLETFNAPSPPCWFLTENPLSASAICSMGRGGGQLTSTKLTFLPVRQTAPQGTICIGKTMKGQRGLQGPLLTRKRGSGELVSPSATASKGASSSQSEPGANRREVPPAAALCLTHCLCNTSSRTLSCHRVSCREKFQLQLQLQLLHLPPQCRVPPGQIVQTGLRLALTVSQNGFMLHVTFE